MQQASAKKNYDKQFHCSELRVQLSYAWMGTEEVGLQM